jgi:hypothetical protein
MLPTTLGRPQIRRFLIGVPLAVAAIVLGVSTLHWMRSSEASVAMVTPAPIDGERAFHYLKTICEMGPHVAGTDENARVRLLAAEHFRKQGAEIREQPFEAIHPRTREAVRMVNLLASWHPERKARVVIGAHYDTRPFPDEERDPVKRKTPFVGANDPASGIAMLMELAHHLSTLKTPWGVDLVLFDGEELVYGGGPDYQGEYFLGSKAFARSYADSLDSGTIGYQYAYGFVLDLIAGKNAQLKQEPYSLDFAPGLVKEVWAVARALKSRAFKDRVGRSVLDDHLPLNNAGIPTIDIIDFEYPHWHRASDLPQNCSAESLTEVGRVLTAWLTQNQQRRRSRDR